MRYLKFMVRIDKINELRNRSWAFRSIVGDDKKPILLWRYGRIKWFTIATFCHDEKNTVRDAILLCTQEQKTCDPFWI
jgi:hypothetical protein